MSRPSHIVRSLVLPLGLGVVLVAAVLTHPFGVADPARGSAAGQGDPSHGLYHDVPGHLTVPVAAFLQAAAALPTTGWTITASDAESASENGAATNAIDGRPSTIYHSWYTPTLTPLPHWLRIDLGGTQTISGLAVTPRQDGGVNGRIGQYRIETSTDGTSFTEVATGTWADDASTKSISFGNTSARYVELIGLTEAGGRGPWTSAAEVGVLGPVTASTTVLDRTGWTACASDAESAAENGDASQVLDGNGATLWRSRWSSNVALLPHWIRIDLGASKIFTGLRYTPRQDGSPNGRVGQYRVETSSDGRRSPRWRRAFGRTTRVTRPRPSPRECPVRATHRDDRGGESRAVEQRRGAEPARRLQHRAHADPDAHPEPHADTARGHVDPARPDRVDCHRRLGRDRGRDRAGVVRARRQRCLA